MLWAPVWLLQDANIELPTKLQMKQPCICVPAVHTCICTSPLTLTWAASLQVQTAGCPSPCSQSSLRTTSVELGEKNQIKDQREPVILCLVLDKVSIYRLLFCLTCSQNKQTNQKNKTQHRDRESESVWRARVCRRGVWGRGNLLV